MKYNKNIIYAQLIVFFCIIVNTNTYSNDIAEINKNLDECEIALDNKPTDAANIAGKLLSQIDSQIHPLLYGQALGCLGWYKAITSDEDGARKIALQIENIIQNLEPNSSSLKLQMRSGSIYHVVGDRVSASENYQKAYNVTIKLNLKAESLPILVNLGILNAELNETENALENFHQALELMEEIDDFSSSWYVLHNLGSTLIGGDRFTEGLEILQGIKKSSMNKMSDLLIIQYYQGIQTAYSGLKKYNDALEYSDKILLLLKISPQNESFTMGLKVLRAEILLNLNQKQEARQIAIIAYDYFANPSNQKHLNSGGYNPLSTLSSIYESLGEYKKSLELLKVSSEIDNKLQNSFNKKYMAQMQARFADVKQLDEFNKLKNLNIITNLKLAQAKEKKTKYTFAIISILSFMFWQRKMNKNLKDMSYRDSLTQIGNRRAIKYWVENTKKPNNTQRLLWLFDLDGFKKINDQYGHDIGDMVLVNTSKVLQTFINKKRFVGRWGGEEFIMITDDISQNEIKAFAKQVLGKISEAEIKTDGKVIKTTSSIGVSNFNSESKTPWDECLILSDTALYKAKGKGRNRAEFINNN